MPCSAETVSFLVPAAAMALPIGLANGDGGHTARNALRQGSRGAIGHVHGDQLGVVGIVVNDQPHHTRSLSIGQLLGEGDAATLRHSHLAGQVQALEILSLAHAWNHHILQFAQPCQGVEGHRQAPGLGVGHLGLAVGEIRGHTVGVVGAGYGGGVGADGGGTNGGIVRVGCGVLVGAPQIIGGAGAVIAGGNGHNDILRSNALVNEIQLRIAGSEACRGAQGPGWQRRSPGSLRLPMRRQYHQRRRL